jgi:hypothetical protein
MERVKIALDEAKESIGAALLPVVQELTAWILNNFIPALEAFIAGLTGQDGLNGALTSSQRTAIEWGKRVRGFIDAVVDLKDEIIIMAGVMVAAFTVSKIAAGVTGLIALVKSLILAYNALKSSAIVAGVAQAFALNPALGVGAVALAAGVLSGANALANKYNTDTGNLGANTGAGLGNRPLGGVVSGSTAPSGVSGLGGFTGGITGGSTGSTGSSSAKSQPTLIEQVTQENFIKNLPPGAFDPGRFRQKDEGNVIINVNAPSIIDRENFSRVVVEALNESNARAGGGGGQLVL